jgi:hypothetical protein
MKQLRGRTERIQFRESFLFLSLISIQYPTISNQLTWCKERAVPSSERPVFPLVLFFTCLLAAAFASQCFFYSLPFAGLQVKRVTLYFLNDVLGLYLPLKPPKRVFEGFSLLKSNFCQRTTPPHPS